MNASMSVLGMAVGAIFGCSGAHSSQRLSAAYGEMARRDSAVQWNDEACRSVATELAASAFGKHAAGAHYRAGLTWQRCGRDKEARAQFEEALQEDRSLTEAQVEVALFDHRDRGTHESLELAIESLRRLASESGADDPDRLATLSRLLLERRAARSGSECGNDVECAHGLLMRALGRDPNHLPSRNQLAMYHLVLAQHVAARPSGLARRQVLLLGEMLCEQTSLIEPHYAPIYNTLGLIRLESGDSAGAAEAFDRARSLDPRFFDAQMNFGALNSQCRDFAQAEDGYRKALAIRPESYEACIGLAEARREQSAEALLMKSKVQAARDTLQACKRIAPSRPEAYYDEAVIGQDFTAKEYADQGRMIVEFQHAAELLSTFIRLAGRSSRYASKVAAAQARLKQIRDMERFLAGPRGDQSSKPEGNSQ